MHWLAIESATLVASVAVGRDSQVLAEVSSLTQLTHSQRLLPMVDQALQLGGVTVGSLDAVVVSAGPGSFTGLRIGLSTAKGIAHARQLPLIPVSTLDALAWQQTSGFIVPLLDARRSQVYTAVYERLTEGLRIIMPPSAIGLAEFLEQHVPKGRVVFTGEGAVLFRSEIERRVAHAEFSTELHSWPRASSLASLAIARQQAGVSPAELHPIYLRASAAEKNA